MKAVCYMQANSKISEIVIGTVYLDFSDQVLMIMIEFFLTTTKNGVESNNFDVQNVNFQKNTKKLFCR